MPVSELLLPEFDAEMVRTRKTLERLPDEMSEYKPHSKSMSLLKLGNHTADMPGFLSIMLSSDAFDVAKPGDRPAAPVSGVERLERFDAVSSAARKQLAEASDDFLHGTFKLSAGEHVIFDGPRYHAIRTLFFNHMIHHRAQLGVYLRLNDCAVPSIYGPSADEGIAG